MSSIMEEIAASTASSDVISHWIGVIFPFSAEVAAAASKFTSTGATFSQRRLDQLSSPCLGHCLLL